MTTFGLLRRNTWRKPTRTLLMMLSVAVAFLIYGLGQGFLVGAQGSAGADENRLVVQSRAGPRPAPARRRRRPDRGDAGRRGGCRVGAHPRIRRDGEERRRRECGRSAAMAGIMGAELGLTRRSSPGSTARATGCWSGRADGGAGWRIGQSIALTPFQVARADEGALELRDRRRVRGNAADTDTYFMIARYDYVNAARARDRDSVDGLLVLPRPGHRTGRPRRPHRRRLRELAVGRREPNRRRRSWEAMIRQIADFGLIVTLVTAAAFVTILMIVANTMAFAVRERTFEIGVLKVLGFSASRRRRPGSRGDAVRLPDRRPRRPRARRGRGRARRRGPRLALTPVVLLRGARRPRRLALLAGLIPAGLTLRMLPAHALRSR